MAAEKYRNCVDLVLEGGAVKGLGVIGAVSRLLEGGYTFFAPCGNVGGAIVTAVAAAVGKTRGNADTLQLPDFLRPGPLRLLEPKR